METMAVKGKEGNMMLLPSTYESQKVLRVIKIRNLLCNKILAGIPYFEVLCAEMLFLPPQQFFTPRAMTSSRLMPSSKEMRIYFSYLTKSRNEMALKPTFLFSSLKRDFHRFSFRSSVPHLVINLRFAISLGK